MLETGSCHASLHLQRYNPQGFCSSLWITSSNPPGSSRGVCDPAHDTDMLGCEAASPTAAARKVLLRGDTVVVVSGAEAEPGTHFQKGRISPAALWQG